ncbi:hypothetical protein Sango_1930600 [Sesamum angolense]|uniref:Reverse transcriptase n=1 Tax=Sesamum angolense TaxID=2727404 RepID=A0AAE1WDV7_9LAMI|nr:hypothetical protein Sango_1930600 [Sesamum angolense]
MTLLQEGELLNLLSPLDEFFFRMTLLQEGKVFDLLSPLEVLLCWMNLLQEGEVFDLLSPLEEFLFRMTLLQEVEVFDLLSSLEQILVLSSQRVWKNSSGQDFSNLILETEDVVLAPSGEGIIQTDTEDVARRMARYRQGRSMGDEPEAHSASPNWGIGNAPTQRILNRVRKQHHLDLLAIMEPMVPLDKRFMARRLGFLDVISNCGNQIWLFWGPDVRCHVFVNHEQLLHIRLESNKWPKPLFVTAVYAKCDTVERRALWDVLRAVLVGILPWIVSGDFNTILSPEECSGGSVPSSIVMLNFHDAIADSAFVDAGHIGSSYTWYSRRLRQRLDRVLVFGCWMAIFPKMQVTHLELSQSDHCGLLVEAEYTVEWKVSSFISSTCAMHSEFLRVVRRNWQYLMVGSGLQLERQLKEADEAYDHDPCHCTLVEQNRCSVEEPVFPEEMDSENLEDCLTDEDRWSYVMPTLEEVREAVFRINPDSVAGPDGFGAIFFHTCWDIVSEDVFGAVTKFFRGVEMPKCFITNTISLIPKIASPASWSEYRPISLCNVMNQICMKLLTIRLGRVLQKVLSLSQSDFVRSGC